MRRFIRFFVIAILSYTCAISSVFCETSPRVEELSRRSIVYILFDVTDSQGQKERKQGTGFIISPTGYILTAAHLFREWEKQTSASKFDNPIYAWIGGRKNETGESERVLQLINPGNPSYDDIALLKLPDPARDLYPSVRICLSGQAMDKTGDSVKAFGFPLNHSFQPVPVTLGTRSSGHWAAEGNLSRGMSGGPVYNEKGTVMGLVRAGIPGSDAVNFITPISYAGAMLIQAGVTDQCDPPQPAQPSPAAPPVIGAIALKWSQLGEEFGKLGVPVEPEYPTFDGLGRAQKFKGGYISWHPETGAYAVWGEILQRWLELGRERFGYPITDPLATPGLTGRYNHFQAGPFPNSAHKSIYWSASSGAHEVQGPIRAKWEELGWEGGIMGFPISAEMDKDGGKIQHFQRGSLYWSSATGVIVR